VRFDFVQPNTVAQIELLSRAQDKRPWRRRGAGRVYDLQDGAGRLAELALDVNAGADRFWLLRVREPQSVFGTSPPRLDIGIEPARLVFAARGEAPFMLAWGSTRAQPAAFPLDSLLRELAARPGSNPTISQARIGAPLDLSGGDARRATPATRIARMWDGDGEPWLLWMALGAGVGLLGWMAWRLQKQMGSSPSPPSQ
jgi:hypothetical protein